MKKRLLPLLTIVLSLSCSLVEARERWLFIGDSITQAGYYVDYVETWLLLNEADAPEIIDLGLSSETVSGLSEPDHAYPRPYLHARLAQVLERVHPDVVIACYGMNCGIYHPFSEARLAAYQDGIKKLVTDCQAAGAQVILLTPPPYAGRVSPKAPPLPGEPYGYKTPDPDYNEVLQRYADWILSLDGQNGIRALTIRPAMERFMESSYPKEPVHPNPYGHELMGEAFLQGMGWETGSDLLETGINPWAGDSQWNALIDLVRQQREIYDRALLNDIGHGNPSVMDAFKTPLPEAEMLVETINDQIIDWVSLNQAIEDYENAWASGDFLTVESFFAPNAKRLHTEPQVWDRDEIRRYFTERAAEDRDRTEPFVENAWKKDRTYLEIRAEGNIGYDIFTTERFKALHIWEKQADCSWKIRYDMGMLNHPAE